MLPSHVSNRSCRCAVPSNIRAGPSDADVFRGHSLTSQRERIYRRIVFILTRPPNHGPTLAQAYPGDEGKQTGCPAART